MQTINSTLSILNSSFLQSLVIKIIGLGIIWFGITSNFLFHGMRDCWGQERFQSAQSPTSSPKRRGSRCWERQRPWPSHRQLEAKPATLSNYNASVPSKEVTSGSVTAQDTTQWSSRTPPGKSSESKTYQNCQFIVRPYLRLKNW